jgi:hypothetical protein
MFVLFKIGLMAQENELGFEVKQHGINGVDVGGRFGFAGAAVAGSSKFLSVFGC